MCWSKGELFSNGTFVYFDTATLTDVDDSLQRLYALEKYLLEEEKEHETTNILTLDGYEPDKYSIQPTLSDKDSLPETETDLFFDPIIGEYFDPTTKKYYRKKSS